MQHHTAHSIAFCSSSQPFLENSTYYALATLHVWVTELTGDFEGKR